MRWHCFEYNYGARDDTNDVYNMLTKYRTPPRLLCLGYTFCGVIYGAFILIYEFGQKWVMAFLRRGSGGGGGLEAYFPHYTFVGPA